MTILGGSTIGPFLNVEPHMADRLKRYSFETRRSMRDIVIAAVTAYIDADAEVAQRVDIQVRQSYGGALPPPRISKRDMQAEAPISVMCEDHWDPGYRAEHGLPPLERP